MCYQCRQEGHYARDCLRTTAPKPTETKMEKMRLLLQSMTPAERAQFRREITPQMTMMQAHLRTMSTNELKEFKRQIVPNATRTLATALENMKTTTDPLSRETSPHADQTITEFPPSRETGPHHAKSMKRLAQALKKRTKHEVEQRTNAPKLDRSFEMLAKTLKRSTQISYPDSSIRKLADILR